jgi:predicted RNA-binding protein with PIN domain
MRLIVDGYNAIHHIPQLLRSQDQRAALCDLLIVWKRQGNFSGSISVVFDSKKTVYGVNEASIPGVRCIYARDGRSADDQIVAMVQNSAQAKGTIVISDDQFLAKRCRAQGARVEPVGYLLKPRPGRAGGNDKNINPAMVKEINDKLKKEWGMD